MGELKPCPFCGGLAVLNSGEYSARYTERKKDIPKGARLIRSTKYPNGKTYHEYRNRAFIPQCEKTSCLGRVYKLFETEAEAIDAWNKRAENEELKFTREFVHENGLDFALASAWKRRT